MVFGYRGNVYQKIINQGFFLWNLSRSKIVLFLKMTNMSLLMVFSNVHFMKLCEVLFLLYTLEYYQFIFSTHTVFLITQNSEKEKGLELYFFFFFAHELSYSYRASEYMKTECNNSNVTTPDMLRCSFCKKKHKWLAKPD